MKIEKTIPHGSYVVTAFRVPLKVTAILDNGSSVLVLNTEKSGQYSFIALSSRIQIDQDDAILTKVQPGFIALSGSSSGGGDLPNDVATKNSSNVFNASNTFNGNVKFTQAPTSWENPLRLRDTGVTADKVLRLDELGGFMLTDSRMGIGSSTDGKLVFLNKNKIEITNFDQAVRTFLSSDKISCGVMSGSKYVEQIQLNSETGNATISGTLSIGESPTEDDHALTLKSSKDGTTQNSLTRFVPISYGGSGSTLVLGSYEEGAVFSCQGNSLDIRMPVVPQYQKDGKHYALMIPLLLTFSSAPDSMVFRVVSNNGTDIIDVKKSKEMNSISLTPNAQYKCLLTVRIYEGVPKGAIIEKINEF